MLVELEVSKPAETDLVYYDSWACSTYSVFDKPRIIELEIVEETE